jgi:hypothetical protein
MVRMARVAVAVAALVVLLTSFGQDALAQLPPAPIPVGPAGPPPDRAVIAPPRGQPGPGGGLVVVPPDLAAPDSSPLQPGFPAPPPRPIPPPGPIVGAPPIIMPPPPPVPPPPPMKDGKWTDRANCPSLQEGWFGDVELDLIGLHIKNRLIEHVTIDNQFVDTVHLPTASLDWTVSPRFAVGYRLPSNGGELTAAFRFIQTDGTGTVHNFDDGGDGNLRSSLNVDVVDLAYGASFFSPGPYWDVRWRLGVRMTDVFFDSQAFDGFLEKRTTNQFIGIGPLGSLEAWRRLDVPGLAVFGRLEGSVPVGSIHQGFEEVLTFSPGHQIGGATSQRQTQAVPTLQFDLGLGWTPPTKHYLRLSGGYHLEQWWDLGSVNDSNANLTSQGLFLRGEFSY